MTDTVVNVNSPNISGDKVTYNNIEVTTSTPNVITDVSTTGLTTSVTTDTLNFVFKGIGEDSIPNPSLFKRNQEYSSLVDLIKLKNLKSSLDQIVSSDYFSRILTYRRIFTELKNTSELVKKAITKRFLDVSISTDVNSKVLGKVSSDTLLKSDTKYLNFGKSSSDIVQKSDLVTKSTNKNLVEIKTFTDTLTRIVAYKRTFLDVVDATDDFLGSANVDDDQIARIGKNLVDYSNTADINIFNIAIVKLDIADASEQTYIKLSKQFSDSYTSNEQKYLLTTKVVNDGNILTDVKVLNVTKRVLDSAQLSEQNNKRLSKVFLDTGNIFEQSAKRVSTVYADTSYNTDLVITQWNAFKVFTDISVTSDLVKTGVALVKLDNAILTDTASKNNKKVFSDYIYQTDTFARSVNYNRIFLDFVDATDDFLGQANIDDDQIARVGKVVADTVIMPESLAFYSTKSLNDQTLIANPISLSPRKVLSDSFSKTDVRYVSVLKSLNTQTSSLVDIPKIQVYKRLLDNFTSLDQSSIKTIKVLNTNFYSNDILTTKVDFNRTFLDTISATDDFLGAANIDDDQIARIGKNAVDYANLLESVSKYITTYKQDVYLSTDSAALKITKQFNDLINKVDLIKLNTGKTVRDISTTQDGKYYLFNKLLSDLVVSSDTSSKTITKKVLDNFASTDTTYKKPGKVAAEILNTSDVLTFLKFINYLIAEAITSTDSGFINNQSYFAGTYVTPGYVGTNTYFT